ncbi:hypothetical protein [Mitsuaria sp. 7]|uniref:hypothetical protein n=1 Tax=Mitsuaria sp. 7 TaxID=1658665 RepID=UPI0007DD27F4|nr:hypothetical protein [Mitsuaria sp. 7]ANH69913.1 hypothetical protein ABE85_24170 [Mitsuaria sp. 7]
MAINSDDLFELARHLATCADEASQRASISRAYYASYHQCIEWEKQLPRTSGINDIDRNALGVHASLIRRLRNPDRRCSPKQISLSISIGKRLDQLRKRRGRADYDIKLFIPHQLVEAQLALAKTLLDDCHAMCPSRGKVTRRKHRR